MLLMPISVTFLQTPSSDDIDQTQGQTQLL